MHHLLSVAHAEHQKTPCLLWEVRRQASLPQKQSVFPVALQNNVSKMCARCGSPNRAVFPRVLGSAFVICGVHRRTATGSTNRIHGGKYRTAHPNQSPAPCSRQGSLPQSYPIPPKDSGSRGYAAVHRRQYRYTEPTRISLPGSSGNLDNIFRIFLVKNNQI